MLLNGNACDDDDDQNGLKQVVESHNVKSTVMFTSPPKKKLQCLSYLSGKKADAKRVFRP